MFKVSKQKSRTPSNRVAFFLCYKKIMVIIILLNGLQIGKDALSNKIFLALLLIWC